LLQLTASSPIHKGSERGFRLIYGQGSQSIHILGGAYWAMNGSRILVVEDEPLTREAMVRFLESEGFSVRPAADVPACRAALSAEPSDVVILDLGLPGQDGLVLARELQDDPTVDVIVVTMRGEPEQRIAALDNGADDYLVKPVHLGELAARIRAIERRRQHSRHARYRFAEFTLDVSRRTLYDASNAAVPLTRGEYEVLFCLAQAEGKIISREALSQAASRRGQDGGDIRSVDALVSRLRRKLGVRTVIVTAPGFGYRLATT
jgi:DNA-binding response OmpR family regulator